MSKLTNALESGLTVEELIEELQSMDPESRVVFAYNYGDHGRTEVAEVVTTIDEGAVEWSEYHRMPKTIETDDGQVQDDVASVVVINLGGGR
jgi:hypothetical protein